MLFSYQQYEENNPKTEHITYAPIGLIHVMKTSGAKKPGVS